jgi:predicted PhzF superfamily epimerase YddE/YHI9
MPPDALRYTAFAASEGGGNPAGVVLDARGMSDREMQALAADIGFSETAFLFPEDSWTGSPTDEGRQRQAQVRYFSPLAEVPFVDTRPSRRRWPMRSASAPDASTSRRSPGECRWPPAARTSRCWRPMQLVQRERDDLFHARNPFPPGGVVEDPATGAAAAALGGYLRALDFVPSSRQVRIHQGDDMGRPSLLLVDIPEEGGIDVTGAASPI